MKYLLPSVLSFLLAFGPIGVNAAEPATSLEFAIELATNPSIPLAARRARVKELAAKVSLSPPQASRAVEILTFQAIQLQKQISLQTAATLASTIPISLALKKDKRLKEKLRVTLVALVNVFRATKNRRSSLDTVSRIFESEYSARGVPARVRASLSVQEAKKLLKDAIRENRREKRSLSF